MPESQRQKGGSTSSLAQPDSRTVQSGSARLIDHGKGYFYFYFFIFQQCSTYKSEVENEINGPMK